MTVGSRGFGGALGMRGTSFGGGGSYFPGAAQNAYTRNFVNAKYKKDWKFDFPSQQQGLPQPKPFDPFAASRNSYNSAFPSVPQVNIPTTYSSIDAQGIMKDYLPQDVVQKQTNNQVAQLQQQADPFSSLQRMASTPGNLSSASSGQNLQQLNGMLMPYQQQAAQTAAMAPAQAELQRSALGRQLMGAQAREAMGLSQVAMGGIGDQLDLAEQRRQQALAMASSILGRSQYG